MFNELDNRKWKNDSTSTTEAIREVREKYVAEVSNILYTVIS